ncbi:uncharacterized protein LOC125379756 [Haliotis rufescens]|uniref:uncharacterized protein LOC125379756 n=1 Tax=Haliotis rufescens TaxID=6454 RepID=UPI00201FA893|nr:uncharacterized protein LOC125379756 [Haliotis rufescens]
MKFHGAQDVLLLFACLLIVHEAATRRTKCTYRHGCQASLRLSAAAVCRQFADTESSCRSCHCQAPSSLRCRQLCAFRKQIAICAREFLCPPTTTAMTAATTAAATTATTSSTTSVTSTTTAMTCGSFDGMCLAECPDGTGDENGNIDCSDGLNCCLITAK